jgi:hypothetical protein
VSYLSYLSYLILSYLIERAERWLVNTSERRAHVTTKRSIPPCDEMLYKTLVAAFVVSSGDALRIDGLNSRRAAITSAASALSLVPLAAFAELKQAGRHLWTAFMDRLAARGKRRTDSQMGHRSFQKFTRYGLATSPPQMHWQCVPSFLSPLQAGDADIYARADSGKLNAARVRTLVSTHGTNWPGQSS